MYHGHFREIVCCGWTLLCACMVDSLRVYCVSNLVVSPHFVYYFVVKMGYVTTLEFLKCIRQTDTTERFYCTSYTDKIYKISLCDGLVLVCLLMGIMQSVKYFYLTRQVAKMCKKQVIL